MQLFRPPDSHYDLLSIPDAYKTVWGAGQTALGDKRLTVSETVIVGEKITHLFERLDLISEQASVIINALPDGELPKVRFQAVVDPVTDEMNSLYAYHSAGRETPVNPFMIQDERLTALTSLYIFLSLAKNNLQDAK
ncbi:hypothetical protein H7Y63_00775 [Polaromonas sp.]|nr:hypothetical protein [Candidatus Saccharibacteria bacterium]